MGQQIANTYMHSIAMYGIHYISTSFEFTVYITYPPHLNLQYNSIFTSFEFTV